MEKLKDLLHDVTDILLAVVIAFAMFAVVSLYLGDWFQADQNVVMADNNQLDNEPVTPKVQNPPAKAPDDETNDEEPNSEDAENLTDSENTPEGENKEETPPVTVVEVKTITIPNGTPGVGIAAILVENGLLDNAAEFINAAEALGLSLKLKSGTFEISTDTTVEEMVKIIAKQQ